MNGDTHLISISSFSGQYDFLSNFYRFPMKVKALEGPTAEHIFQALKVDVTAPDFEKQQAYILISPTPSIAKNRGRKVQLRSDWEEVKIDLMRDIIKSKFSLSTEMGARLLSTGDAQLIEGNTWGDLFWGVDTRIHSGQNWLGKILMDRRHQLRQEVVDMYVQSVIPKVQ